MEENDIYDAARNRTGRLHRRGTPWNEGEYGLMVCVWVHDGRGSVLLTRRAAGKSEAGTWENSGGAARAGETSRQAVARELFEETGIRAAEGEFERIATERDGENHAFFDFYCLKRDTPLEEIVLLPGETDGAVWVSLDRAGEMVKTGEVCPYIGRHFLEQEAALRERQSAQEPR